MEPGTDIAKPETRLRYWPSLIGFAVVAWVLLVLAKPWFAPEPIYKVASEEPGVFLEIAQGEAAAFEFEVSHGRINGLLLYVLFDDGGHRVRTIATNPASGEVLAESEDGFGLHAYLKFRRPPAPGDTVRVTVECLEAPAGIPAKIKLASRDPRIPILVETAGGDRVEGKPLFLLTYGSPLKAGLWAWGLVALGFVIVLKRPRGLTLWVVVLGGCCVLTSSLGWQQRYATHSLHLDPDRYGSYAERLAQFVGDPSVREKHARWIRDYEHAHIALAPAVMSLPILAGMDWLDAYTMFSALCSFGTLLLFHSLLTRHLKLPHWAAICGLALLACHLVFLRSFARPTTDRVGLLLIGWMLWLWLDRLERRSARQEFAIAMLAFMLALVRPPGPAYSVVFVLAVLGCDWWRMRRVDIKAMARTFLFVGVIPVVVLSGLYFGFGWFENLRLAVEKSKQFHNQSTPYWFWTAMVTVVQFLVIGLVLVRGRDWKSPATVILASWAIIHTLLLILVRAPFLDRLFLPILPALVALACLGLGRFDTPGWSRWLAQAAVLLVCGLNVSVMIYVIHLPAAPPYPLDHYIY